jgi:regulator of CtrA degradation
METAGTSITPKLIDSLYVEAMLLVDEARSYFDRAGREERLTLDPIVRVAFSCESLKVTTRLMHVIAWLLTHRAAGVGERELGSEQRLGDAPESDVEALESLPPGALHLIEASRDLYARVRRLDDGSGEVKASPVRSLMSLLERSL